MRLPTRLIPLLMLSASVSAASGCAERVQIQPLYPPASDLAVEPKPVPPPEIVTSAQAAAEYDIALEAHGDRGWLQIARLCRFFRDMGMEITCPEAE